MGKKNTIAYGYVRNENKQKYERIVSLVDTHGKPALKATHLKIVEYIGSFQSRNGCFSSLKSINKNTIRSTERTLKRHLDYLVDIGVLIKTKEDKDGDPVRVLRLGWPNETVKSQRDYRLENGLSEYAYANSDNEEDEISLEEVTMNLNDKNVPSFYNEDNQNTEEKGIPKITPKTEENSDVFFAETTANLAFSDANLAEKSANLAPILINTNNITSDFTKLLQPKVLPHAEKDDFLDWSEKPKQLHASHASESGLPAQPHSDVSASQIHREKHGNFSSENNFLEEDCEEILPNLKKKKGIKINKTAKERQAEAMMAIRQGHICNPLGITDNRPRRLVPKNARDISADRSVTIPQLFRHLIKKFDDAFGEGMLAHMLPNDKTAITSMFGELKQKFIDNCKFSPDNRDLASYIDWFLLPTRIQSFSNMKYAPNANRSYVHFKQMNGTVFIRKFYEEIIRTRSNASSDNSLSPEIAEFKDVIHRAFSDLRKAYTDGNNFSICMTMIEYGWAMSAQFLHDEYELDESQVRQRIIAIMSAFIQKASKPERAVAHLKTGIEMCEKFEKYLLDETSIWWDWKNKTSDLIQVAIQQSGVSIKI